MRRLGELLETVLLEAIAQPIVIFIDEIDSTLSLPFNADDFFALIRACHEYKRLTFALLGVATPGDLIADKTRTPFNIGRAIQLNGFQWHEVEPLGRGLVGKVDNPQEALQEQSPIAEQVDEATILFADIVGFTSLSSRIPPLVMTCGAIPSMLHLGWNARENPEKFKSRLPLMSV